MEARPMIDPDDPSRPPVDHAWRRRVEARLDWLKTAPPECRAAYYADFHRRLDRRRLARLTHAIRDRIECFRKAGIAVADALDRIEIAEDDAA
jgi:hypothetical protein